MSKMISKRMVSAFLCAAMLSGCVLSASAAQVPQTPEDASAYSQRSSLENLIIFEPHAIVHGGQRYTKFFITIPEDAIVINAIAYKNSDRSDARPIQFNGNTAFYEDSGMATQPVYVDIYLKFPDGNVHFERSVDAFSYICGMSHERNSRCYDYGFN